MFVVEAIQERENLHDCMIVREFETFEAARMFVRALNAMPRVTVTRLRESRTHQPTPEEVTMNGRFGCE